MWRLSFHFFKRNLTSFNWSKDDRIWSIRPWESPVRAFLSSVTPTDLFCHVYGVTTYGVSIRDHFKTRLPAQPLSGPNPTGLMTLFSCLTIKTPLTSRARFQYLYTAGWTNYTRRHWVPFASPPTTRRAMVELFEPSSTRDSLVEVE
jgi:hypothetical protein